MLTVIYGGRSQCREEGGGGSFEKIHKLNKIFIEMD